MDHELSDVIARLQRGSNRRQRPTAENWRGLNHLKDEDVLDLTASAYTAAMHNVYDLAAALSEDEQQDARKLVNRLLSDKPTGPIWNNETIEAMIDARHGLNQAISPYTLVSDHAYNKFIVEARRGKPSMLLDLVVSMRDPRLANKLLSDLRDSHGGAEFDVPFSPLDEILWDDQEEIIPLHLSLDGYIDQKWREEIRTQSRKSGLIGSLALKRKLKKGKGKKALYQETITNPLKQIKKLPPVSLQLLHQALTAV
jgi:hypothetical protein